MLQRLAAVKRRPACRPARTSAITHPRRREVRRSRAQRGPASGWCPARSIRTTRKPTTRYTTRKTMPANARAGDAHALRLEHAHWPLICMLVLTQLAAGLVGCGFAGAALRRRFRRRAGAAGGRGVRRAAGSAWRSACCTSAGRSARGASFLGSAHFVDEPRDSRLRRCSPRRRGVCREQRSGRWLARLWLPVMRCVDLAQFAAAVRARSPRRLAAASASFARR